MQAPVVSIIVPVYNVEKYFRECLNSILGQTMTDFELLLINDGSTDNSGKICDEYALMDPRVHVFHKKNGGVSSARNYGLDKAKGKWVTFIDSDDWVDATYLEHLLQGDDCVDYRVAGFVNYTSKSKKTIRYSKDLFYDTQIQKYYEKYLETYLVYSVWGNLYLLDIINSHNIRFDIQLQFCEDNIFNFLYIENIKSIAVYNYCEYHYRYVPNSLIHTATIKQQEFAFQLWEKEVLNILNKYGGNRITKRNIGNRYLDLCVKEIKYTYKGGQSLKIKRLQEMFLIVGKYDKQGLLAKNKFHVSFSTTVFHILYFVGNIVIAHKFLHLFFRIKYAKYS